MAYKLEGVKQALLRFSLKQACFTLFIVTMSRVDLRWTSCIRWTGPFYATYIHPLSTRYIFLNTHGVGFAYRVTCKEMKK